MTISIDDAIERLNRLRGESKLGGDTALLICFPERDYIPVESLAVENDPDGAVALVCGKENDYYPGANIGDRELLHRAADSLDEREAELWAAAINAVTFDPTLAGPELTAENFADLERHLATIRGFYMASLTS